MAGGKVIWKHDPAEPDDPNSFSLNPNEQKRLRMGRGEIEVDKESAKI